MASDATFNSLISLATWIIWKWRNDAVFNYSSASVQCLLQAVDVEIHLCVTSGAQPVPRVSHPRRLVQARILDSGCV